MPTLYRTARTLTANTSREAGLQLLHIRGENSAKLSLVLSNHVVIIGRNRVHVNQLEREREGGRQGERGRERMISQM